MYLETMSGRNADSQQEAIEMRGLIGKWGKDDKERNARGERVDDEVKYTTNPGREHLYEC